MDDAHAPTHAEHTGHGAHHVNSRRTLLATFGALVVFTVITVAAALGERAGWFPLGGLSVPFALAIAGTKATLVAAYFMGLKYDGGTNLLAFVGGVVFLAVFLTFTYLDTGFRDTFEERSAVPVDVLRAEEAALQARQEELLETAVPPPVVSLPDTALFPNAPTTPPVTAAPASPAPSPATPAAQE
jgi:cytochrome c oxidase subunit 4